MRRAKILVTLGPKSETETTIGQLIEAGANAFRLNFSHGSHPDHRRRVQSIRRVSNELGVPVSIVQDLSGPKLRTGELKGHRLDLHPGDTLLLSSSPIESDLPVVPIDYPNLAKDVAVGSRVLMDDGRIELEVIAAQGTALRCRTIYGGRLGERKGVNFPGVPLSVYAPTEKDRDDLSFGLSLDIDYVALSFVRRPQDLHEVKRLIAQQGKAVPLIAKIERPEALDELPSILDASDGVMVARGDLGVELPPERVPVLQKQIVEQANHCDRLVIIATQMLESMIHSPRPTRAEASDVANAVIDGADAVMLSGETAIGDFPVETVRMMARIVEEAERSGRRSGFEGLSGNRHIAPTYAHAIAHAAREIAHDMELKAIVAFTQSGFTARMISKDRPRIPILAATPNEAVSRQLALLWGVTPVHCPFVDDTDGMIRLVEEKLVDGGDLEPGDLVVIMGGMPVTTRGPTNFLKIHLVRGPK